MAQRPPLLTPSTSVDHSAVAGPGTDHQQNQQNYSNSAPPNNASLSNFAGTLFKSTKRFTVSQFTCQTFRKIRKNKEELGITQQITSKTSKFILIVLKQV